MQKLIKATVAHPKILDRGFSENFLFVLNKLLCFYRKFVVKHFLSLDCQKLVILNEIRLTLYKSLI